MAVPPLISTETLSPHEQYVGQEIIGPSINPTDANVKTASVVAVTIGLLGILLAVRNPRYALEVMTGTMGAALLGAFVALSKPTPPTGSGSDLGSG